MRVVRTVCLPSGLLRCFTKPGSELLSHFEARVAWASIWFHISLSKASLQGHFRKLDAADEGAEEPHPYPFQVDREPIVDRLISPPDYRIVMDVPKPLPTVGSFPGNQTTSSIQPPCMCGTTMSGIYASSNPLLFMIGLFFYQFEHLSRRRH